MRLNQSTKGFLAGLIPSALLFTPIIAFAGTHQLQGGCFYDYKNQGSPSKNQCLS